MSMKRIQTKEFSMEFMKLLTIQYSTGMQIQQQQ